MKTFKFLLCDSSIVIYIGDIGNLQYVGLIEFYNDSEYMRFDAETYINSLAIEEICNRARDDAENCQSNGSKQTDQYLIACYMQINSHEFTQINMGSL